MEVIPSHKRKLYRQVTPSYPITEFSHMTCSAVKKFLWEICSLTRMAMFLLKFILFKELKTWAHHEPVVILSVMGNPSQSSFSFTGIQ